MSNDPIVKHIEAHGNVVLVTLASNGKRLRYMAMDAHVAQRAKREVLAAQSAAEIVEALSELRLASHF